MTNVKIGIANRTEFCRGGGAFILHAGLSYIQGSWYSCPGTILALTSCMYIQFNLQELSSFLLPSYHSVLHSETTVSTKHKWKCHKDCHIHKERIESEK